MALAAGTMLVTRREIRRVRFERDRELGDLRFPLPSFSSKWQVSRNDGGEEPRWRRDGKELFYLAPDGRLMAAEIRVGAAFETGSPAVLFQTHPRQPISAMDFFSYDVTTDGQKFLVNTKVDTSNSAPLSSF